MEQYLKNFKNCLQKEIPFCSAACPFDFDILDFIEKSKRGGFLAAFKTYRNSVGFPKIVNKLCPQPCKQVCPMEKPDQSIDLNGLEQACISYAGNTSPTEYNLPTKKNKIAIIGAGISGLACALRLATKKYEVEIFEKSDKIGGNLWDLMEPSVFLPDIEEQFKFENYALHLNKEILKTEELTKGNYDAVYVATGALGTDFGLKESINELGQSYCKKQGSIGWFAGGSLIGSTPIYALADGLYMGTVIDNFLKTGNLIYAPREKKTSICLRPEKIIRETPVMPTLIMADGSSAFTKEEAIAEALRCIECQCDACRIHCDLTNFYNKWPIRIRDEVIATTLPGSAEVKATPAKRLISTCSQCGLCKEVCPEDIDLGGLILAGRRSMHRQDKMPWAFHDFWLRDMDFANGEFCALVKMPKNVTKCTYAFFPGCQLGACEPEITANTYDFLLSKASDTGIILRCCGVPAEWAGHKEKHENELENLKADWISLGKPTLIMACPTCMKKFKEHLPEIQVTSLYEFLATLSTIEPIKSQGLQKNNSQKSLITAFDFKNTDLQNTDPEKYEIFHPCSSGNQEKMRESIRALTEELGYRIPPKEDENLAKCCSYGGQVAIANPKYAKFVMGKRISESEKPYITYCINCRDAFLSEGKEAVHILELLFPKKENSEKLDVGKAKLCTVSKRQENRVQLKKDLLKKYWSETMTTQKKQSNLTIEISQKLSEKLSEEKILEEDIISVLDFCEKTGKKVYNKDKNTFSGYKAIGYMTYWVEYRQEGNVFRLVNAYCHRIKIEMEAVWNGKKSNYDLQ